MVPTQRGLIRSYVSIAVCGVAAAMLAGCQSAAKHRSEADSAAADIIDQMQREALGRNEPFTIDRPSQTFRQRLMLEQNLPAVGPASYGVDELEEPEHWPNVGEPQPMERTESYMPETVDEDGQFVLTLVDALQIAAANSRSYQSEKESVFNTALQLDLERFRFDTTFFGTLQGIFSTDQASNQTGARGTAEGGFQRQFESGADLSGRLVVDLVRLLSGEGRTSLGLLADGSISIPLLRGAGRHIVTEPRTQAERNVLYALYDFELFKLSFAVQVANQYFSVLQQLDRITNAEASYRRLMLLVERTEALHDKGRTTGIEVDEARQDLLRARDQWIVAQDGYSRQLDQFKMTLGLPSDARIELSTAEFDELMADAELMLGDHVPQVQVEIEENGEDLEDLVIPETDPAERGRYELDEDVAIAMAMENRLDLRIAEGDVYDAQRRVIIAADQLRPGLNLTGNATFGERRSGIGSATAPDARLDPSDGFYSLGAQLDMPWSRRSERIAFRQSLIRVEAAVRNFQNIEDNVKLDVRDSLRDLRQQREGYRIQEQALSIAERRVRQTQAFQEVGRADTRDVLIANDALLQAQNSLVNSLVRYRIAELSLQRDLGLLQVDHRGLWNEYELNGVQNEEEAE